MQKGGQKLHRFDFIHRSGAALLAAVLLLLAFPVRGEGESARYTVDVSAPETEVSPTLFGLFLEDINFAVDAGLWAQMLRNPSFEYAALASGGGKHGWSAVNGASFSVEDGEADGKSLNANNPHYARIENTSDAQWAGVQGTGYLDGLSVTQGEGYVLSLFAWPDPGVEAMRASLRDTRGNVYAQAEITGLAEGWRLYEARLAPRETVNRDLRLVLEIPRGCVRVDSVSLMPEDTFSSLPIRKDLGEMLAALEPAFLRFPGGCVIEGKSLESMYNWKDSIGNGLKWEAGGETFLGHPAGRRQAVDIWNGNGQNPYYMSYGLGFYEYFCLCEALDCLPVPVVNAGMTCQVQSPKYIVFSPDSDAFRQCVQDALDLVEFCRGGASTPWGAVRCAMGHEAPFALRYIAVGNEQWQREYYQHYQLFVEAFRQAARENPALYGDVRLIVANGTSSDSAEGWDYVDFYQGEDEVTALVDEHFYNTPDWFLTHTDRYDRYDRSLGVRVFLGEYASQSNRLLSALAEAAFMTGLERNGDVVEMACYAPLFGNDTLNQWNPDLIYFSNRGALPTVNYYVQQLFSQNALERTLKTQMDFQAGAEESVLSGRAGLGSWMTSVAYDNLLVRDNGTGEILLEENFDGAQTLRDAGMQKHRGAWRVQDGRLIQMNTRAPADPNTGDAVYFGDPAWQDYTLTVDAEILSGAEGFLIPVCVQDPDNQLFWNVGGWGNTLSCLQIVAGGAKSGQVEGTVRQLKLKQRQVYRLQVTVAGNRVQCYLDGKLLLDYEKPVAQPLYQSAGLGANGDLILKFVNVREKEIPLDVTLSHFDPARWSNEARAITLRGDSPNAVNAMDEVRNIAPEQAGLPVKNAFSYTLPGYSLTVIRIPALERKE